MVAMGLIAMALMMVLGLIPGGIQSSQRAADLQAAAAWSRQLIEETPAPDDFPIPRALARSEFTQQIGPTFFQAVRTVQVKGPYLYRIEVSTTWQDAVKPLVISLTRFHPGGPDS